jgi:hypothetical protein
VKLTEAERSTLNEMSRYSAYWFRQATCAHLVAKGFAIRLRPDLKWSAHRITPAGRAALEQSKEK